MALSIIDETLLDELLELGREIEEPLVQELHDRFQEEFPRILATLKKAIECCDYDELNRTAHSLKGSSGALGATVVHALCESLEQEAIDTPRLIQVGQITEIELQIRQALQVIRRKLALDAEDGESGQWSSTG